LPQYKFFTWNLQRSSAGGTSANKFTQAEIDERKSLLTTLCDWADFGFLTEVGKDIRQYISSGSGKALPGHWHLDLREDGQKPDNPCKNAIYSKAAAVSTVVEIETHSSRIASHRFPAAGIYKIGEANVMLVALHATSGGSGASKANVQAVAKEALEKAGAMSHVSGLVMGGDFNYHFGCTGKIRDAVGDYTFAQTDLPTNQGSPTGKGGIDGFYLGRLRGNAKALHLKLRITERSSTTGEVKAAVSTPMPPKMLSMKLPTKIGLNRYTEARRGYVLTLSKDTKKVVPDAFGYSFEKDITGQGGVAGFKKLPGDGSYIRLSDHCPVVATVDLEFV